MDDATHEDLERIAIFPAGPLPVEELSAVLDLVHHTGECITADADNLAAGSEHIPTNIGDLRHCMDQVSPHTVAHLLQTWGAACALLTHIRETSSELTAIDSIRLVMAHYGGIGGIQPNGWQTELISLIERGDTLQRASLTAAYPGLVQAITVQENGGAQALYHLYGEALAQQWNARQ